MRPGDEPGSVQSTLRLYYVLRAIGSLSNQLLQFAVPVLIYEYTGSVAWSGIALVVEWLPRLTSLPLAGPLVDRFSVRRVYLVSDLARCVAAAAAAMVLSWAPGSAQLTLMVLALVAGSCFDQTFIAGEKAVRLLAPPEKVHRAQSVLGTIDQATLLLGPALGGVLIAIARASVVFTVAVLFAASFVLARLMPSRLNEDDAAGDDSAVRSVPRRLAAGFRVVRGTPVLRNVVATTILVNLMLGTVLGTTPAFVLHHLHRGGEFVGVVYTISGLGSVIGLAFAARLVEAIGLLRLGIGSTVIAAAALIAVEGGGGTAAYVAIVTAFMVAESLFTVFIRTVRARVVAPRDFGSAVGVIVQLNFTSMPVAGALVAVTSHYPLSHVIAGVAVGSLLVAVVPLAHLVSLMSPRSPTPWMPPLVVDELAGQLNRESSRT